MPTVEECISRGVFGAEGNVFTGFRQKGKQIVSYENDYVLSVNSRLVKPMGILTENRYGRIIRNNTNYPIWI